MFGPGESTLHLVLLRARLVAIGLTEELLEASAVTLPTGAAVERATTLFMLLEI